MKKPKQPKDSRFTQTAWDQLFWTQRLRVQLASVRPLIELDPAQLELWEIHDRVLLAHLDYILDGNDPGSNAVMVAQLRQCGCFLGFTRLKHAISMSECT